MRKSSGKPGVNCRVDIYLEHIVLNSLSAYSMGILSKASPIKRYFYRDALAPSLLLADNILPNQVFTVARIVQQPVSMITRLSGRSPFCLKKPLEISLAQYAEFCFFQSGDKRIARLIPHQSHCAGLTRSFVRFYKDNALIADIVNDTCLFYILDEL